jgi:hypothetical protein
MEKGVMENPQGTSPFLYNRRGSQCPGAQQSLKSTYIFEGTAQILNTRVKQLYSSRTLRDIIGRFLVSKQKNDNSVSEFYLESFQKAVFNAPFKENCYGHKVEDSEMGSKCSTDVHKIVVTTPEAKR